MTRVSATISLAALLLVSALATADTPFYAMDTATRAPGVTPEAQLDMIKELGYAGIAWTECDPKQARDVADAAKSRGLSMFTIYCAGSVSPEGFKPSPRIVPIMQALKGHDTIIWLHIAGKGIDIATLKGEEPAIQGLRQLADEAAKNNLRIAIYPHVGEWTAKHRDAIKVAQVVNRKNFGVTFNLCHCLALGDEANIPAILEEAGPLLFTVTINGADAGVSGAKWKQLIQPLDKGTYDVGIVLKKLKQLGYTGAIGFQGYGIQGERKELLTSTMNGWKKLNGK